MPQQSGERSKREIAPPPPGRRRLPRRQSHPPNGWGHIAATKWSTKRYFDLTLLDEHRLALGADGPCSQTKSAKAPLSMEIVTHQTISSNQSSFRWALCVIIAAVIGDVAVTEIVSLKISGYDWMKQSISSAGRSGSSGQLDMAVWGVFFTALFCSYGSLLRRVSPAFLCVTVSSWLISIYAVCEGLGSGLFPFDDVAGRLTVSGMIHIAFGVVGNLALWAIPFALLPFFLKYSKRFYWGSIGVIIVGAAFVFLFVISGLDTLADTFVANRGLWQRLFLLCSYGYLIALSVWLLSFYRGSTSRVALAPA